MEIVVDEKEWLMECVPTALPDADGREILQIGKLKFALPSDSNIALLYGVQANDDGNIKLTASGKTLKIEGKTSIELELTEPVKKEQAEEPAEPEEPKIVSMVCLDNTGYEDRLTVGKSYAVGPTNYAALVDVDFDDGTRGPSLSERFKPA